MKYTSTMLTFLKVEDTRFNGDRKHIQEKNIPKKLQTEMGQEMLLGEDVNRTGECKMHWNWEYTCSVQPAGKTAACAH